MTKQSANNRVCVEPRRGAAQFAACAAMRSSTRVTNALAGPESDWRLRMASRRRRLVHGPCRRRISRPSAEACGSAPALGRMAMPSPVATMRDMASKLRTCAIGPELVTDPEFGNVRGEVAIWRDGERLWSKAIGTGESVMCHSLANLEHHHFKFAEHRRPGDLHVHFFGADAFSFGEGVRLADGDWMEVRFDGFGRPLRNRVQIDRSAQRLVKVRPV